MGGATFGPSDAIGPGACDVQKVKEQYCPTPCQEWCDFTECWNCIPADPCPHPPPGQERNGFLALAEYDKTANGGNNDGKITSLDSIFSSLRLWQDLNHNGVSEVSELKPLNVLGLSSIELDYKVSKKTDEFGNAFRYRAKVTNLQGTQMGRWAWDVFLVSAP